MELHQISLTKPQIEAVYELIKQVRVVDVPEYIDLLQLHQAFKNIEEFMEK